MKDNIATNTNTNTNIVPPSNLLLNRLNKIAENFDLSIEVLNDMSEDVDAKCKLVSFEDIDNFDTPDVHVPVIANTTTEIITETEDDIVLKAVELEVSRLIRDSKVDQVKLLLNMLKDLSEDFITSRKALQSSIDVSSNMSNTVNEMIISGLEELNPEVLTAYATLVTTVNNSVKDLMSIYKQILDVHEKVNKILNPSGAGNKGPNGSSTGNSQPQAQPINYIATSALQIIQERNKN